MNFCKIRVVYFIIILCLLLWNVAAITSAYSNAYLNSQEFDEVSVLPGATLWTIAAKRTDNTEDIRKLVMAIVKINNIDNKENIYPGQTLKIPVIR